MPNTATLPTLNERLRTIHQNYPVHFEIRPVYREDKYDVTLYYSPAGKSIAAELNAIENFSTCAEYLITQAEIILGIYEPEERETEEAAS